ncbi:MAG UNVERIFIED_CONTAM: hypothetical protein LVT10_27035 [Anaerolineae bacterium]
MLDIGILPQEVALGGLSVYTTVDLQINNMVQDAIANQVNQLLRQQCEQRRGSGLEAPHRGNLDDGGERGLSERCH